MSFYLGRYAQLYDLFYRDKPYVDEARFVHDRLSNHGGAAPRRVLEIACGTGRHAIELARLGCDVSASDCSASMLDVARNKGVLTGSNVEFSLCDMREIPVPGEPFDAVVCLFDSIGYVGSDDELSKVFRCVRSCVKAGGLFLFEYWHAPTMKKKFDPLRVRKIETENSTVLRLSETTLDLHRSTASVKYDIYELERNGTFEHFSETQTNRFFAVPEMAAFAGQHGFEIVANYAGFALELKITDDTWHVVSVWRKTDLPAIQQGVTT